MATEVCNVVIHPFYSFLKTTHSRQVICQLTQMVLLSAYSAKSIYIKVGSAGFKNLEQHQNGSKCKKTQEKRKEQAATDKRKANFAAFFKPTAPIVFKSPVQSGLLALRALDWDWDRSIYIQIGKKLDQTGMDWSWAVFCGPKTGLDQSQSRPVLDQSRPTIYSICTLCSYGGREGSGGKTGVNKGGPPSWRTPDVNRGWVLARREGWTGLPSFWHLNGDKWGAGGAAHPPGAEMEVVKGAGGLGLAVEMGVNKRGGVTLPSGPQWWA